MKERKKQEVFIEDTCEPKYYARIPNMIDDLDLSVYAYRLYGRIKRVAGDAGACWQSVETLSKGCSMSAGSIVNARRELTGRGLIRIEWIKNESGGRSYPKVSITNVWPDNIALYDRKDTSILEKYSLKASSPDELQSTSPGELASSCGEVASSPHELKNNPLKNNTLRKTQESDVDVSGGEIIKNPGAYLALKRFEERQDKGADLADWPEDTRPWLQRFLSLWQRTPPAPTKSRRGGDFALWISELRALKTACSEFGVDLLDDLFTDWQEQSARLGREPYTLARPGSLVKAAQSKVGERRIKLGKQDYKPEDIQAGKDLVRDGYYQQWLACKNANTPIPPYLQKAAGVYGFTGD